MARWTVREALCHSIHLFLLFSFYFARHLLFCPLFSISFSIVVSYPVIHYSFLILQLLQTAYLLYLFFFFLLCLSIHLLFFYLHFTPSCVSRFDFPFLFHFSSFNTLQMILLTFYFAFFIHFLFIYLHFFFSSYWCVPRCVFPI